MVDDSSEHIKSESVNKNVVAARSHNEYKDVLLSNKCLRRLMTRIQSKNHRKGTNKINKMSLLCLKCTSKSMDMMDQFLVIRVNYKNRLS